MQTNETYQINQEILGILVDGHPRKTVKIPKGATVRTVSGPVDGQRIIDVQWNGKVMMVFAQDLRERGELVEQTPKAGGPILPETTHF